MDWQGWFTIAVLIVVFVAMVRDMGQPDILLMSAALILCVAGIVSPSEIFAGFSNEAMLTVAGMFVVVAGLRETGALDMIGKKILGKATTPAGALGRMALWINTVLVFLGNTPIVAMMLPIVTDWCHKNKVSPSRMLMPLSFMTVLRGTCTLVGTSTNLVVSGLIVQAAAAATDPAIKQALRPVSLLEITPVGVVVAALGITYLLTIGIRMLPNRHDLIEEFSERAREYLINMRIEPGCRLAGQTVEQAGLRNLPGLFLVEVNRREQVFSAVGPDQVLEEGDRLTFTGVVGSIVDVERIPGLVPDADANYSSQEFVGRHKRLCEAVISQTSPLIGKSIRDAEFRSLYQAAVMAVHRNGHRLEGRVGDIVLREGDTLLLQTGARFHYAHRNNPDFILVSAVDSYRPLRHSKAPISVGIILVVIALMSVAGKEFAFGSVSYAMPEIAVVAFIGAALMIGTRCISTVDARRSPNMETLLCIAAAFGLGKAMQNSGAAEAIADLTMTLTSGWGGPVVVLCAVYLVTMVLTELLSNAAAAALMFPLGLAIAEQMGVSPRPFAISIMFAASLAFATPIGYQTNLMVYGPGGYKFTDFTRVGLPLNIITWITASLLIPVFWPFRLP